YAAYFNSFRVLADRADTIRMPRLAQSLSAVVVKEKSGYGSDEMAYEELSQRVRWKSPTASMISREELAQQGTVSLCEAIPLTMSGARSAPFSQRDCRLRTFRVLLNGMLCEETQLTAFTADAVEAIEYYPPRAEDAIATSAPAVRGSTRPQQTSWLHGGNTSGTDVAGTLAAHACPAEVLVIWMRPGADTGSQAGAMTERPALLADTTGRVTTLPPVEVREAAPVQHAYLQGQVVDSADRPLRSALVYTEDPLFATLTDKKGFFRLAELTAGPITVRAERNGFVPIEFQLRLPPDTTVGIGLKLIPAPTRLGTMQIDSSGADGQGRTVRVIADNGQPIIYAN